MKLTALPRLHNGFFGWSLGARRYAQDAALPLPEGRKESFYEFKFEAERGVGSKKRSHRRAQRDLAKHSASVSCGWLRWLNPVLGVPGI
jgi:hypothetical protein